MPIVPAVHHPRTNALPRLLPATLLLALLTLLALPAAALPAPAYYATADTTDAVTLRQTLHDIIDDHTRTPYSSPSSDASWPLLETADQHPAEPTAILDVYKNETYPKVGGGTGGYQREHTWPQAYGFPNETGTGKYPRSDHHAIFLADASYNGSRGFTLYRACSDPDCDERPTVPNLGRGGEGGPYPGDSNWRLGVGPSGTWETWTGRRGDVARAVLYMDVRYDGSDHQDGSEEPNLVLTNDLLLIESNGGANQDPAFFGVLSDLLRWHRDDPVDDLERARHEVIAAAQGRNPFLDHPEWVACVFEGLCAGEPLLLNDERFRITLTWQTDQPRSGAGHPELLTTDTGYFWFFRDTNVEVVVKVLDGCPVNGHYWVFAAGLTNVAVQLHVEDTERSMTQTYTNPLNTPFQPIQDTAAFATCP
jgi:endonuclease I